ncbi:hypothetical protein F503_03963 [Ophiostoma piceae UAMH 11346]|uniref:Uncharacterized protein n=1 Tax=Ophiostoma piceae (strain UAMH 11346) TaxID=1262450 RepID=S3C856_OPHP1|nr:hypothetical protein F503_03963 [Ophiostoma piceae UAMH 11346]
MSYDQLLHTTRAERVNILLSEAKDESVRSKIQKLLGLHRLKFIWPWTTASRQRWQWQPLSPREDFERHCVPAVQSVYSEATKVTEALDERATYFIGVADEFVEKTHTPGFKSFMYIHDSAREYSLYAQTVARAAQTIGKAAVLVIAIHQNTFMHTLETTRLFPEDGSHESGFSIETTTTTTMATTTRNPQDMRQDVTDCLADLAIVVEALHLLFTKASAFDTVPYHMADATIELADVIKQTLTVFESDHLATVLKWHRVDWADADTIKSSARVAMAAGQGLSLLCRSVKLSQACLNCAAKMVNYAARTKRSPDNSIEGFAKSRFHRSPPYDNTKMNKACFEADARLISFMVLSGARL